MQIKLKRSWLGGMGILLLLIAEGAFGWRWQECGVKVGKGLAVRERAIWQEYTQRFIRCQAGWLAVTRSVPGESRRVKRVVFKIKRGKGKVKRYWPDTKMGLALGHDYRWGGRELVYYLWPMLPKGADEKEFGVEVDRRVGMTINQVLAGLSDLRQKEREEVMKSWDLSGKGLEDMGLKLTKK